ncbi:hypothetical protein DET49_11348 [Salegentibacter sp. 24]|uniref:hypothetical protein n=1 Tax=Salegentibacter sp. 24 TaxID=2183986 RepID=UPI00105B529A|nr:hypothetical protein [Salegentibacter sp. 24]TDN87189.1 hypothetical protein DET49_11348 [Salegentibacter sp. 24]
MKRNVLFLLLLIFITPLFSQQRAGIKGKILVDSIDAPVHIINITAEKGTLTQASGEFEIEVKKNDLLLFSSVEFEKKEIIITSEILTAGFLEIALHKNLTELDEVRLHRFSGNLAKDIEGIETYDPRALGFPLSDKKPLSIEERKLVAVTNPNDPVGVIYGIISGENKMLKKAIENNKRSNLVYKVRDMLPDEFYRETLALDESKIMDFLYYCAQKPIFKEIVSKEAPLMIIEFLKETITPYNEFTKD